MAQVTAFVIIIFLCIGVYSCAVKESRQERIHQEKLAQERIELLANQEKQEAAKRQAVAREEQMREKRRLAQEAEARRDILDFAEMRVPELARAIEQTSQLERDLRPRLDRLSKILAKTGYDQDADDDYRRWFLNLLYARKSLWRLEHDLQAAYLAYQKFMLAPDIQNNEQVLNLALTQGRQSALDSASLYTRLKGEIGTSPGISSLVIATNSGKTNDVLEPSNHATPALPNRDWDAPIPLR